MLMRISGVLLQPVETSERIFMDDVGSEEQPTLNMEEEEYGEEVEEAGMNLYK